MKRTPLLVTAAALAILAAPLPAGAELMPPPSLQVTPDKHLQILGPTGTVLHDLPLAGALPLVDTPDGKAVVAIEPDGSFAFVPYAAAMAALFAHVPPPPAPSINAPGL